MTNFLSYDIEIYNELEEGEKDFSRIIPSVAALVSPLHDVEYFYDIPYMTKKTAKELVNAMMFGSRHEFTIFGWNTLSFDFPLLAHYSGMIEECAKLALNSVDGMFLIVSQKGYPLSLDAALVGAGLETKIHNVTLNDKTQYSEMNGKEAPRLWREGEYEAVKTYLKGDVIQPLQLANKIELDGKICWTSKKGHPNSLSTKLYTVKECLTFPEIDQSWMDSPKPRKTYYDWIPESILKKELI